LKDCSKGLVIYEEPTHMQALHKYVYRALKTIKESTAPEEFYRHLRDSIQVDSMETRYTGGEEWIFK